MSAIPETRSVDERGNSTRMRSRPRDLISLYLNYPILFPMRKSLNRRALEIMRKKLKVFVGAPAEIEGVQRSRLREPLRFCSLRNPFFPERFRRARVPGRVVF